MKTADFLSQLEGVKRSGKRGWLALCPGHDDHKQSLSIIESDGKILLKCFAGCEFDDIMRPLNLEARELFLDGQKTEPQQRKVVAVYKYTDANGKPFETVRFEPKDFSQRRPDGNGDYIWNLEGIVPTLYHQDELRQAIDNGSPVNLVEGEKDADRLRDLGIVATTNPMGAGKWRDRYTEALSGADLVIIPDNDKAGREHAQKVAKACYGIAKRVRIQKLPGESHDVSDWLDKGGDTGQLKQLVDACYEYEPSDSGVKLRRMADVKAEKVDWLWKPYIPKGKVTLAEGDPGVGKSWVSLAIATAISLGRLPNLEIVEPANVVIASAEDGLGDTIRPRLDAMGADGTRILAIDGPLTLDENGFALLEAYLERTHPALLIIDPLVAYLGAALDIYRPNEVRAVMSQLARLAEKYGVAVLAVRHLNKGSGKAIYRGLASIDFTAACRSVLLAGCDAEDFQTRALVHIKSNLAPMGVAIGYELRDDGFYWTGESSLTAAQILATESGETISPLNEALSFLKDELADEALAAKDVYRDAEGVGISKRTLNRAKAQLGVTSRKHGEKGKRGGGIWVWELPADLGCQDIPLEGGNQSYEDLHCQDSYIKESGNLNLFEAEKEVVLERPGNLNTGNGLDTGFSVSPITETDGTLHTPLVDVAVCANTGSGDTTVSVEDTPEPPDKQLTKAFAGDSRPKLLAMAKVQGFPRLDISQGIAVKAGEDDWQKFATNATQKLLEGALMALEAKSQ